MLGRQKVSYILVVEWYSSDLRLYNKHWSRWQALAWSEAQTPRHPAACQLYGKDTPQDVVDELCTKRRMKHYILSFKGPTSQRVLKVSPTAT